VAGTLNYYNKVRGKLEIEIASYPDYFPLLMNMNMNKKYLSLINH